METRRARFQAVLTVTRLTDEISRTLASDSSLLRFAMLPFIALPAGHRWANTPPEGARITGVSPARGSLAESIDRALREANAMGRVRAPNGNRWIMGARVATNYIVARGPGGREIGTDPRVEVMRIAHPAVLSLSLQMHPGPALADDHILSITTRLAARSMPLVVAAGNWGLDGETTLSPLANLPWTIAVGSMADEAGTRLHPESSIGVPGSHPTAGVTVVAYGENRFVPGKFGTSFAVPRVVVEVLTLTAFVLQVRRVVEAEQNGAPGGVPILQRYAVDTGFKDFVEQPSLALPMLPRMAIDEDAVLAVFRLLKQEGITFDPQPSPTVIRRMLVGSARPVAGYQSHEVGAGFVNHETTIDYLGTLDGLRLAGLFMDASTLSQPIRSQLGLIRPTNTSEVASLASFAARSSLIFSVDFHTGRIYGSMEDPVGRPEEGGFIKMENTFEWPPSLTAE